MAEMISFRLDDDARRALAALQASGASRSDAIRQALITAAEHLRDRRAVAGEAAALADDPVDAAEARAVAAMMEDLRAPW